MNSLLHKKLLDSIAYLSKGKYAIAVSGGSDSLALLHLCAELNLKNFIVIHFNHNIRDESTTEANFVKQESEKLGFKYKSATWSSPYELNGNFYQLAREARYNFFSNTVKEFDLDGVLVAHSKTDLAETFLMRVTKGASLKGVSIFPQGKEIFGVKVYRPLLDFSRSDLQSYLNDKNLNWVKDPSNKDLNKMRPRVRSIIPKLEEIGLSMSGLKEAVKYFNQANDAIDYYTKKELSNFHKSNLNYFSITSSIFFNKPIEIQIRILNMIINTFSTEFNHNPRRKNIINMLNRLKLNKTTVEVVDCITLEIINGTIFIYSTEYDFTKSLTSKDNSKKIVYLQDINKKTRYNIIKQNKLQFLPISIRNRVKVSLPKNQAENKLNTSDFTCLK